MTDTAILGNNVEVVQAAVVPRSASFSWSAAVAGALAAIAVTFLVVSLGSGIGLSLASPYRTSPSATALTAAAAVWLVMAQAFGFACGGYLAARLRNRFSDVLTDETTFRDAAQGFVAWALAVAINLAVLAAAVGLTGFAAATLGVATGNQQGADSQSSAVPTDYYIDVLFRAPNATAPATSAGQTRAGALSSEERAEVQRILAMSLTQGRPSDADRSYLVQLVTQRTGVSQDEAGRRVDDVLGRIREAADKVRKAGAFASFWAFMSLLIGATAATLAGIVGGELRDRPDGAVR